MDADLGGGDVGDGGDSDSGEDGGMDLQTAAKTTQWAWNLRQPNKTKQQTHTLCTGCRACLIPASYWKSISLVQYDSGDGNMVLEADAGTFLDIVGDAGGGGGDSGGVEDGTMGPDELDLDFNGRDACGDGSDGNGGEDGKMGLGADFGAVSVVDVEC